MPGESILIVDDDKNIQGIFEILLNAEGYKTHKASCSKEALDILSSNKIDLIILDVMLGEKTTGFDLFNKIIEMDNTLRVVFVSALNPGNNKKLELKAMGSYDYILKPFDNKEMISIVKRSLKELCINGTIIVGYGDIAFAKSPKKIQTVLGSCVAVVFYDPEVKLGGMTHIMIPETSVNFDTRGAKQAVENLMNRMISNGAAKSRLVCEIYGGSNLFDSEIEVGKKNVEKAKKVLKDLEIRISKEDTGGKLSRQICLDTSTGKFRLIYLEPIV